MLNVILRKLKMLRVILAMGCYFKFNRRRRAIAGSHTDFGLPFPIDQNSKQTLDLNRLAATITRPFRTNVSQLRLQRLTFARGADWRRQAECSSCCAVPNRESLGRRLKLLSQFIHHRELPLSSVGGGCFFAIVEI
jgi:hypothetical protein